MLTKVILNSSNFVALMYISKLKPTLANLSKRYNKELNYAEIHNKKNSRSYSITLGNESAYFLFDANNARQLF